MKKVQFTCFMNCVALKSSLQPYKMCLPCFPCKNQTELRLQQSKQVIFSIFPRRGIKPNKAFYDQFFQGGLLNFSIYIYNKIAWNKVVKWVHYFHFLMYYGAIYPENRRNLISFTEATIIYKFFGQHSCRILQDSVGSVLLEENILLRVLLYRICCKQYRLSFVSFV